MIKEKIYQYGMVDKDYSLKLTYKTTKNNVASSVNAVVEKEASLNINLDPRSTGCCLSFWEKVLEFQKESNKIIKLARKLMRQGINIKLEYIVAAYEDIEEREEWTAFGKSKTRINQISFNAWRFDSTEAFNFNDEVMEKNAEDKDGGFYLMPDERYTSTSKAIWIEWGKNFIENIAENSYCEQE